MARSRNLKPGFFKNEFLALLSPHARLLFAGLWLLADRRGRLEDRPMRLKGELFPFESVDAETLLQELANSPGRFITRYMVENERFIQIEKFHKHQNPHHREAESSIPPYITERPKASLGLDTTQAMTSLENSGTSRADSFNPITDSLKSKQGDAVASCVNETNGLEKNEQNQRLAQAGLDYLVSLNSPNHINVSWVRGYLGIQLHELEQTRPEITKAQILDCWRDTCDLAVSKNNAAPQWLKSVFKNKLDNLTPDASSKASLEANNEQTKALLTFPFISHRLTGEIFPTEDLQLLPEAPNGLTDKRGMYYPASQLQGVTEIPTEDNINA